MEHLSYGPYKIIRSIASGASASVFEAEHNSIKRRAALKLLHPHLISDPKSLERLRREAEAVAKLDHKNVVKVFDCSIDPSGKDSWIACEFVNGWTLRDFRNSVKGFRSEFAVFIAMLVAEALKAAHSIDIVHRDLKPENILVGRDGSLKLADFGIASMQENERLTLTGALLGSPGYMAPEQIEGGKVDNRADIFSFGVLCYWLLTGSEPFAGATSAKTLRNSAEGHYVPANLLNPAVNRTFSQLIDKCLKNNPEDRFVSIDELLSALFLLNEAFGFGSPDNEFRELCLNHENFCAESAYRVEKAISTAIDNNRFASIQIDLLSQALLLYPGNREIAFKAKKVFRRRGQFSKLKKLGLLLAISVLTAAVFLFMRSEEDSGTVQYSPAVIPVDTAAVMADSVNVEAPKPIVKREKKFKVDTIPNEGQLIAPEVVTADTQKVNSVTAEPSLLKVYSKTWARVSVDGVYAGKTPFLGELRLAEGKHVIMLDNPYCKPVYDTVELIGGQTAERRYELVAKDKKVE
ncbi:MAG: serine/threonine protein kinase [Fibrobacteres bacterium]|nr:serine/threonine protein kinase [Fibrobacterota bacterium]